MCKVDKMYTLYSIKNIMPICPHKTWKPVRMCVCVAPHGNSYIFYEMANSFEFVRLVRFQLSTQLFASKVHFL